MISRFYMPTDVRCGDGVLKALQEGLKGARHPAILCGNSAARQFGHLDAVLKYIPHATVVSGFPENPSFTDVERFVPPLRETGADCLVALGGGSVMDGAKALAILLSSGGACRDYATTPPPETPLPLIAIPTTAGTGSEVTPYAVLVDPESNKKSTLKSPGIFPRLALLDPALTLSLPRDVTLATGLDALSQAMEGMLSLKATPAGNALALDTCRRVYRWLPVALAEPENRQARQEMLYAAMLSGVVIAQSGTTLVHGMGYYYTLEHGIAHGIANALLLPPVFHWNGQIQPREVALLAEALGGPQPGSESAVPKAIATALYRFYERIDFSPAAQDHGVPESALAGMADDIIDDPYRFKNQVGTLGRDDVYQMFRRSWSGSPALVNGET